ncbi:MAG: M23 family metallopeptidase [Actinomycetota bacterium]
MTDPDPVPPSSSGSDRCADPFRRRLVIGAVGGSLLGAFGLSRLGGVLADEPQVLQQLSDAGTALQPATRLGQPSVDRAPDELLDVPEGKVMFPLLPASDCFVLDNYGDARGCCRLHVGVDIMGSENQPVFAVADGVLIQEYTNTGTAGWGWSLEDEENDVVYKYFHLTEDLRGLEVGDTVRRGDVIGYVGDSGTDAGNFHVHFEVRPGNVPVDPLPLLDVPDVCDISDPLRA